MNQRPTLLKPVGPASLADEDDFHLGDIRVRPSLREVEAAGLRESLEPRVMQVLVALARANGAVLSRDELIRQCWGGRIVGDDAINRCVSKVRQLSELGGSKAFEIDTIPRVGYRLRVHPELTAASVQALPARFMPPDDEPGTARIPWRVIAALLVVLIFVAAAVVAFLVSKRAQEWEVVESHQPFISTPDIERFPSFSPDGTMIAYSRGKNAWTRQIFLQLRRGGDPLQLTKDAWDNTSPAFSPDGRSLVYSAFRAGQPCRIMLVQIPAGPSREISRCHTAERTTFTWEPDGRRLFYYDTLNGSESWHIMRYDIETGAVLELTRPGAGGSLADFQPSVSPDGTAILFMRYVKGNRLQVVLRAVNQGPERVVVDDEADKYATWSDDSTTVFVTRNFGSDSSLWAYPASGAAPWRITSNARIMEFLSSGPNGLLAVELKNQVSQLSVASTTSPPQPLDTNGFVGCSFDYAPDGTLALVANDGEAPIIAAGAPGHLHEIFRSKERVPCGIRWSRDGKLLAFGGGDASSSISVINRDGAPVAQVPYPNEDFGNFEWTDDGKGFLRFRLDSHGWRVWRVDFAPPYKARPFLPYGWNSVHMLKGMAFGTKEGSPGIWRIDGKPRRLTDWPVPERNWTWTIAGDNLVYADFSNPDHPLLMAQPMSGGPPAVLGYADGIDDRGLLAANPITGQVTYNRIIRDDPDIGWLRLERR